METRHQPFPAHHAQRDMNPKESMHLNVHLVQQASLQVAREPSNVVYAHQELPLPQGARRAQTVQQDRDQTRLAQRAHHVWQDITQKQVTLLVSRAPKDTNQMREIHRVILALKDL